MAKRRASSGPLASACDFPNVFSAAAARTLSSAARTLWVRDHDARITQLCGELNEGKNRIVACRGPEGSAPHKGGRPHRTRDQARSCTADKRVGVRIARDTKADFRKP